LKAVTPNGSGPRRSLHCPHWRTLKERAERLEVYSPPDTEAKLTHSAAQQGRAPDEITQEIVTQYFEEEARFIEAVQRGEDALRRGEYLTHDQVGQRLQRFLQS
jgi:predicted transcriptional regulator